MKARFLIFLFIILAQILGCSVQSIAVKTTGSFMGEASREIETEGNFDIFEKGAPGNIKMVEGLLYLEPENEDLLLAALKAYSGYGFIVNESHYLNDKLAENDESVHLQQALLNYSKAIQYGLRLLEQWGVEKSELMAASSTQEKALNLLNKKLSSDDKVVEGVFFFAQAYGSFINLQRSNISLISQLPMVKAMFDWSCEKNPEQRFGACQQFYGAYESGRPAALGGKPEVGKQIFLKAIKKYPYNLSHRLAYIQYYIIPMMDEDEYKIQKRALEREGRKFNASLQFSPRMKNNPYHEMNPRLRLFNSMALKRLDIIKKYAKDIF